MKGISIIEIIIILAVISIVLGIVVINLTSFREEQALNSTINESISYINEARSKTLSSKDFSQYGIHFEQTKITLFKGVNYNSSDSNNIDYIFSSLLEISSISLNGGGNEVIFQKITGKTDQFGTVTYRVKNNPSKSKIITIKSTGIIDY
ncbi:MAG: hypothetical protein AAB491_01890 [Patescibacteria group bacterium]